jgi:hypothetical protein
MGSFKKGMKHGKGRLIIRNQESQVLEEEYKGEFVENEFSGEGRYRWYLQSEKKLEYEGHWSRGLKDGEGVLRWRNGK